MDSNLRITIVGGGIGGLTTALQLHSDGFRNIKIFDSSSLKSILGVGINLQPSAVLVLRNLGLLSALEAAGIKTASQSYYNVHGNLVMSEPRGEAAGYLIPQFSIHRGKLHEILMQAVEQRLGGECLHIKHEFTAYTQTVSEGGQIIAYFRQRGTSLPEHESTSAVTGDVLIAADGINSRVRSLMYPEEGPSLFSGCMLWRAVSVLEKPFLGGRDMILAGHKDIKFIAYPIGKQESLEGKSLVNWIAEVRVLPENDPNKVAPKEDYGKSVPKSRFSKDFETWKFDFLDIPNLINSAENVFEFPMCDRDPVSQWSFGRLTLLGDAAHPLYPIGSNGGSQAILDALALSEALQKTNDVPAALKEYESKRQPPTAKICLANRGNGPDEVLELARERAPEGFKDINDVISPQEILDVGIVYKELAGFDIETVNQRARATTVSP